MTGLRASTLLNTTGRGSHDRILARGVGPRFQRRALAGSPIAHVPPGLDRCTLNEILCSDWSMRRFFSRDSPNRSCLNDEYSINRRLVILLGRGRPPYRVRPLCSSWAQSRRWRRIQGATGQPLVRETDRGRGSPSIAGAPGSLRGIVVRVVSSWSSRMTRRLGSPNPAEHELSQAAEA